MKVIDTHSHLYVKHFEEDIHEVTERAQQALEAVFLPNIDLDSIDAMHRLTQSANQFFFPMMGLHPCSVKPGFEQVLAHMKQLLDTNTYYGIGETGIDLYWDKTYFEQQKEALQIQIEWAKQYQLPIILHCRESLDHVIDQIERNHDESLKGIFHCFDGTLEQAKRIMALGSFKMGIGGIYTYRKKLQKMLPQIPLEYIVLETDSPYLPPMPYRKSKDRKGRRNESSYTRVIAAHVATLYHMDFDTFAQTTNTNALQIFSIPNA